jgi:hypothetical protein
MTSLLDKTLKRELRLGDRAYILSLSPVILKLTLKGKRKGRELQGKRLSAATQWRRRSMRPWADSGQTLQTRYPSPKNR